MKFKSKLLPLSFLLLYACSDIPSESSIEKSVSEMFSECEPITVNVKKTNGRLLENGNYLVNTEITLELKPLDINTELLMEFMEKSQKSKDVEEKYRVMIDSISTQENKLRNEFEKNIDAMVQDANVTREQRENYRKIYDTEMHKLSSLNSDNVVNMQKELSELQPKKVVEEQINNFNGTCKLKNSFAKLLAWDLVGGTKTDNDKIAETLGNGGMKIFPKDFEMIKTENGWQLK